jgi:hypothetical protein
MLDNWGNNMTDEVVKKKLYGQYIRTKHYLIEINIQNIWHKKTLLMGLGRV